MDRSVGLVQQSDLQDKSSMSCWTSTQSIKDALFPRWQSPHVYGKSHRGKQQIGAHTHGPVLGLSRHTDYTDQVGV